MPSALGNGTRRIGDAASPLHDFTDFRMLFPTLDFLKRREPGISVAEADHKPERHLPFRLTKHEAAAIAIFHWTSLRTADPSRCKLRRHNILQSIQPEPIIKRKST